MSILERQAAIRYSLKLLIHGSDRRIDIHPVSGSIVEIDTKFRGIRIRQVFASPRLGFQYL